MANPPPHQESGRNRLGGEAGAWKQLEALREFVWRDGSGVYPVRPRLLRQIIKADHDLIGIAVEVPHADCYVMPREALVRMVNQEGYLLDTERLSDPAILVAEPGPAELEAQSEAAMMKRLLALEYHARLHARLEAKDGLTQERARVFERAVGAEDVREALIALQAERRVFEGASHHSRLIEMITIYLETRVFYPRMTHTWFPSLNVRRMNAALEGLGLDLGYESVLGPLGTEAAVPFLGRIAARQRDEKEDGDSGEATEDDDENGEASDDEPGPQRPGPILDPSRRERLLQKAAQIRTKGNLVRAMVLRRQALQGLKQPDQQARLKSENEADLASLVERLRAALGGEGPTTSRWTRVLLPLVRDPGRGIWPRRQKLLYDLQKVCLDAERPGLTLDWWAWLRSLGKAPLQRPLTDQIPVRVHRHLRTALARALKLKDAKVRRHLVRELRSAEDLANQRLRGVFREPLRRTLDEVGLAATSIPEEVAAAKVVEGLLDRIADRDYIGFGDLRDQLSQNDLKMQDMISPVRLIWGDALIKADNMLTKELEGVYRKSPIYMRMLQRMSSLAFGNRVGRTLTRFAAIPLLGAFVSLEGAQHLLHLFTERLHIGAIQLVSILSVLGLGAVILAHMQSAGLRRATTRVLKAIGRGIRTLAWDLPKKILKLPALRRIFDSYTFAMIRRFVLKPLIPAALLVLLAPLVTREPDLIIGLGAVCYIALSVFINSRAGKVLEARAGDAVGFWWARVRYRFLPNLFRFIMETSQRVLRLLERLAYTVDEVLRFRQGDRRLSILTKLVFGSAWSVIMYVVQLYVNLLVEPQINPIKHFPVVTVSHKVILPASGVLQNFMAKPAVFLFGTWIGETFAWLTVVLLPGLFGFLVWELSANWRLYEKSRPETLAPTMVGSHGERVSQLLLPGFHSGTVRKLFARIRRGALAALRRGSTHTAVREREQLQHIEHYLERFYERELLALLERVPEFNVPLRVKGVRLGLTQIRVDLVSYEQEGVQGRPPEPLTITYTERAGKLWAAVRPGYASDLPNEQRRVLLDALFGLLCRSDVDKIETADLGAPLRLRDQRVPWDSWVARWDPKRPNAPSIAPTPKAWAHELAKGT